MKLPVKAVLGGLGLALLLGAAHSQARDDKSMRPINDVLEKYADKLNSDVALYFGGQPHPASATKLGEYPTNKKTNGFNKSDSEACEWVMLSALLSLQERALREGGDAVVNIRSYYKKNELSSETEYECHNGTFVAGVALIGEVVKLDH
ncbi:excinuclease ATPase subunit [uncultured Gilvimarinus sp.]|uniref:excinuclease ATPase subunit n=1 Tax=uncultured Gilvimarinus sp. TaxID=1689143 RepID=UPI0030EFA2A3